jgi:hypothetical protein
VKLPNTQKAVVDIEKLRDYCLCSTHPRGRHKARVFLEKLGLGPQDAEKLRTALLKAAVDVEAKATEKDDYGQRYVLDFLMSGPKGNVTVRSSWIIRVGEDFPRFVTCFIQPRG